MERTTTADQTLTLPVADYEADDVLVVSQPEQLRALGDDLRSRIVVLLREQARSTTDLAAELGLPKGTVGHHLKVLERAGLIRVVRTRKVRAVTEKFYGRVARLFVIKSSEPLPEGVGPAGIAATGLRQAADELVAGPAADVKTFAFVHVRLSDLDARRFMLRLERLVDDVRSRETADGHACTLAIALFESEAPRG